MDITFDQTKRDATFHERGLRFEDAKIMFAGDTADMVDDRYAYGEERIISVGKVEGRMMVIVWTQRGNIRHIISMRKANEREQKKFAERLR